MFIFFVSYTSCAGVKMYDSFQHACHNKYVRWIIKMPRLPKTLLLIQRCPPEHSSIHVRNILESLSIETFYKPMFVSLKSNEVKKKQFSREHKKTWRSKLFAVSMTHTCQKLCSLGYILSYLICAYAWKINISINTHCLYSDVHQNTK